MRETQRAVGLDCPAVYCFPDRADAEAALRVVPAFFELDAEDAETLRIVKVLLPVSTAE